MRSECAISSAGTAVGLVGEWRLDAAERSDRISDRSVNRDGASCRFVAQHRRRDGEFNCDGGLVRTSRQRLCFTCFLAFLELLAALLKAPPLLVDAVTATRRCRRCLAGWLATTRSWTLLVRRRREGGVLALQGRWPSGFGPDGGEAAAALATGALVRRPDALVCGRRKRRVFTC